MQFFKILLFTAMGLICNTTFAQGSEDVFVRVFGKVLNQKDSSVIPATLTYEKLPYYDDMGRGSSGENGFEFYLRKGSKYNFLIKKDGYQSFTKELEVADPGGDKTFNVDFYIQPDEEPELMTLDNLIFSRGSEVISSESYSGLDSLVAWLDQRPNVIIQLEGHTDFAGNTEANMLLSQARVESVKEYLRSKGIAKDRVLTKAFGGTQPLTMERTDEAKAMNRRVEVRVLRK